MIKTIEVTCPHCAVEVINNVISHELGCPNESVYLDSDYDNENPEIENWYPENEIS